MKERLSALFLLPASISGEKEGFVKHPAQRATVPVEGHPTDVRFAGQRLWLWWGADETGTDAVAAAGGRLFSWASERDCLEAARSRGWRPAAEWSERPDEAVPLDLEPAQLWLSGQVRAVPYESTLNLWNLAGDVAYSTGRSCPDRSRLADSCYDRLFAVNVPWLARPGQATRWTSRELRELRRQLDQAVRCLRLGLAAGG